MDKTNCHVDCLSGMGYDVPCITYSDTGKMRDIYRPETHNNKKRETVLEMQDTYVPMSTKNTITTVINDLEHDIEQDLINEKRKHRENSSKYRCLLCSRSLLKAIKFTVIGILLIGGLLTCGRETGTFIGGFFPFINNILNPNVNNNGSSSITEFAYAYTTPDGVKIDLPVYDDKKIESDETVDKYVNVIRNKLVPITTEKVLNYLGELLENKQLKYHEQRNDGNHVNTESQNKKTSTLDDIERVEDYYGKRTNKNSDTTISSFEKLKPLRTISAFDESPQIFNKQTTKQILDKPHSEIMVTPSLNYKSSRNIEPSTFSTLNVSNYNKSQETNNNGIVIPVTTTVTAMPSIGMMKDNRYSNESTTRQGFEEVEPKNQTLSRSQSLEPKNTSLLTSALTPSLIPQSQEPKNTQSLYVSPITSSEPNNITSFVSSAHNTSFQTEPQLPVVSKQVSSLSSPLSNITTETIK